MLWMQVAVEPICLGILDKASCVKKDRFDACFFALDRVYNINYYDNDDTPVL